MTEDLLTFLALCLGVHAAIGTFLMLHSHYRSPAFQQYEADIRGVREFLYLWILCAFGWSWALVKTMRGDIPEEL